MTQVKKVQIIERRDVVSGIWKFKNHKASELAILAASWKEAEPDKYLDLHVRRCSKDQIGISFQYQCGCSGHDEFFNKITDQLKRDFGNDFVGWDIAYPVLMLPTADADWTLNTETNRSNSSPKFVQLVSAVAELIKEDVRVLSNEQAKITAGLIMAQLAHKHGLVPSK